MTLEEFKIITQKANQSRTHIVKNSLGIRQAFAFTLRNKWFNIGRPIKEAQFQLIVRLVNDLLAEEIVLGNDVKFPQKMGNLELRKNKTSVSYKDGELKVTYPIDWDATLKLWYEDEESYNNKTLVRHPEKEVFKVLYNRADCNCHNKGFFEFHVNRDIKRRLKKRIKQGQIDAFLK